MTKQEIEKAIRNGEIIYVPNISPETPVPINLREIKKYADVTIDKQSLKISYDGGIFIYDFSEVYSEEDADFIYSYKNITRTKTLSLPTWEEFKKRINVEFNGSEEGVVYPYELCIEENEIILYVGGMEESHWKLTKENYLKACKMCKKLFLGEEI